MWNEKILKVIPALLFLFCLLEVFELGLVVVDMNKTEKLEIETMNNLKALRNITILLNEHLEVMGLGHFKDKKIKNK